MSIKPVLRASLAALLVCILLCSAASAEIHVGEEKPADWDQRDLLKITFFEEVTDEAILIECGGKVMMDDAGHGPYWQRLWPYLEEHGLTHIDIMYNSHPHYDHLEGEIYLVMLTDIQVDGFYSPFPEDYPHRLQKKAVKTLKEHNIPYHQLMQDEPFKLGNAEIVMYYWPDGQDPNTLSGTLYITFGDSTIMIPSDLTGPGQKYLLETYGSKLKCDILKIPHHGLGRLVTEFLPAVQPQLAIYTNYTKSTEVCDRQLKKYDIPFMHTSAGTIYVETDGSDWYVEQIPHLLDKKAPIPKR